VPIHVEMAPEPAAQYLPDRARSPASPVQSSSSGRIEGSRTRPPPRVATAQSRAEREIAPVAEAGFPDDDEFDATKARERIAAFQQLLSETQALLAEAPDKDNPSAVNATNTDQVPA